jgi:RNA-binding protein
MKDKIKELKPLVHRLKPIIQIGGKGLTEAVQAEINQALEHHELIKIRIAGEDRANRKHLIEAICQNQQAILIQKIGHVFAIYRKKKE